MILVDTNILLRSIHLQHSHHALAKGALAKLRLRHELLCIAPQNLVEFWAVATRPQNENGLGMTVQRAAGEIARVQDFFRLLPYTPDVIAAWQRIVTEQAVIGKQAHDAHLAAIMQVYSISAIVTFDTAHFQRFAGIKALDPTQI